MNFKGCVKNMTKRIKAIIAALLACLMLLSFTGCYGDTNEWAVKVGDTTIETGVYLGYLVNNYLNAKNQVSEKDFWNGKIEEKNVSDWILDETMDNCYSYAYVTQKFDSLGLKLDDDTKEEIDVETENTWSSLSYALEKNGCSKKSLEKIITVSYKMSAIFEHYYFEGGEREIPESELKTYFVDNYYKVKSTYEMLFNNSTFAELSDTEVDVLKKDFRSLIAKITAGEEFDAVVDAYLADKKAAEDKVNNDKTTEVSSGETKSETTSETKSETKSEATSEVTSETTSEVTSGEKEEEKLDPDRYVIILSKEGSGYPEDFIKKVGTMKDQEVAMIETDYYLFLTQRLSLEKDEETFKEYKETVIDDMKGDEFVAEMITEGSKMTVVRNEDAIKRFRPKNIESRIQEVSSSYYGY